MNIKSFLFGAIVAASAMTVVYKFYRPAEYSHSKAADSNYDYKSVAAKRSWEDLADGAIGFGRNATGGMGGEVCLVTNLDDKGAGTLRDCAESAGAKWIRFAMSGEIVLQSPIDFQSDKTVDGRGQRITIVNDGLRLKEVSNIIVQNLILRDGAEDEDAVTIRDNAHDIWLDHLTLSHFGDGLVDITHAATDITVSWCKFSRHIKAMAIGLDLAEESAIRVTLHHNYFNGTDSRQPRLAMGRVHAFNNYLYNWSSYGMLATNQGQLYAENNILRGKRKLDDAIEGVAYGDDTELGYVTAQGNWAVGETQLNENSNLLQSESVFDPSDYYKYHPEPADDALRTKIITEAGWQDTPAPRIIK